MAVRRSAIFVFIVRKISPITKSVSDPSRALICAIMSVNRPASHEDVGVFSEEAKDQSGHEVVHVRLPRIRVPVGIFLAQERQVEAIQASRRPNVESAFADLPNCRDTGKRQEETEMIGELGIGTGDRRSVRN